MFSFLSVEFAFLFIVFFLVYWSFKEKPNIQNQIILIGSYAIIYLMAGIIATSILFVFSTLIFFIGKQLVKSDNKKLWLSSGIAITLINLSFFKYYEFFRINVANAMQLMQLDTSNIIANIIFPLGISYYSFQSISYLVTLYRDEHKPDISYLNYLTYLSFFATISAGPITRLNDTKGLNDIAGKPCGSYEQLITQKPRRLLYPKLAFALILLALTKKWWLAGYLADNWVNPIFANPTGFHSLEVLTAIYGYTVQLFLDFSGYSEMMVAFGLLLGFRLPMNFNAPLLAHNIRQFWDKWHISLSTWIRDYIYIPLGGSRKGFTRTQINLMIAMVLSGIWHGSTINFVLWGFLHAVAIALLNVGDLICQKKTGRHKERNFLANTGIVGKVLGIIITVHFVVFAFVFFRATTINDALLIFKALFFNHGDVPWVNNPYYLLALLAMAWAIYPFYQRFIKKATLIVHHIPGAIIYSLLFFAFILVVILAPSGIPNFIYANF